MKISFEKWFSEQVDIPENENIPLRFRVLKIFRMVTSLAGKKDDDGR